MASTTRAGSPEQNERKGKEEGARAEARVAPEPRRWSRSTDKCRAGQEAHLAVVPGVEHRDERLDLLGVGADADAEEPFEQLGRGEDAVVVAVAALPESSAPLGLAGL